MPKYKYLTGEPRSEVAVSFRLTQPELDKLNAYCKVMGVKKTKVLRQMIEGLSVPRPGIRRIR